MRRVPVDRAPEDRKLGLLPGERATKGQGKTARASAGGPRCPRR